MRINGGQVLPDLQLAIVAERIRDAEHPVKVLAAEDNPFNRCSRTC
jgi:hypothetical protein